MEVIYIKRRIIAFMMAFVVAVSCLTQPVFAVGDTGLDYTLFCGYLPFPCKDFVNSSVDEYKWFLPEYVRNYCDNHYDVDFSDYSLLYTVQQPSIPMYNVWFAKPLSNDSKLQLTKSGKDYYVVAKGDWDVYNVGFQFFPDGKGGSFNYYNIYNKWNVTINAAFLAYCDFSILDPDGNVVNDNYNASIYTTSNGSELAGKVTAGQSDLTVSMGIYDSSGTSVGIDYITAGKCNATETWFHTFDLVSMRTELEDKDVDYDSLIGKLTVTDSDGNSKEYTCSLDGTGEKEGLFSKEKELTPFTDIDDYLTPMPEFPGFDIEHPWESLGNILKWIGDCVGTVVENIGGVLRWLKDNFFILIENIGKLLYNLVVKIRNLIESLFIPDLTKMKNSLVKKFPSLADLIEVDKKIESLKNNVNERAFKFTLLGQEMSINIRDIIPSDLASDLRNLSKIIILSGGFISWLNIVLNFLGFSPLQSLFRDDYEDRQYLEGKVK